jgi:alpha-amylase/alpha-mannosidase (GH57 family)
MKTRVAFLWHMHQPMYTDPGTGEAILPWVRFHATHAYYDMARLLERHPRVRVTVNFVPSLLEQLESIANGSVRERYLELSKAAPSELSAEERHFVIRQFFMANRERVIRPLPRYWELLNKRGEDVRTARYDAFTDDDVRDLQVLFNLGWMGFAARTEEPEVSRLIEKGRGFSEEDKDELLSVQQQIVRRIIPMWRGLSLRGQVELSSTPYFHPILPLVCDTDAAKRAMPDAQLPPRFAHPEDAKEQVRLAVERHTQWFGAPPQGMWPAEGSVSPEALELFAAAGIKWLATDEGVLMRSAPAPRHRGEIFQAWSCETSHGPISFAFRDRALSDRIGFAYASMKTHDAVSDFLSLLRRSETEARKIGVTAPVIPVILDGENAWEHYVDAGEPFLDALYSTLERAPDFDTVPIYEALQKPTAHLKRIHSGSWIDANYRIWIGHPEDNLGWELLGKVRALVAQHEKKGDVAPERLHEAKRLLLSAEGSDWFWWYGDDFQTDNAAEFDALFRDRLIRAATLVGEAPPPRVFEPLSRQARHQGREAAAVEEPTALIEPRIDGRARAYTKWLGAGVVRAQGGQGSMYRSESLIRSMLFGSSRSHCFVRLEPGDEWRDLDIALSLRNLKGNGRECLIRVTGPQRIQAALAGGSFAYLEVMEAAVPFEWFGVKPGDRVELVVRLVREGRELERLPASQPASFDIPTEAGVARSWSA